MSGQIESSISKLKEFIETNNYKGYDPYDGLTSPLFKSPILRTNKTIRLYFQQFIKRFPVNLRPLFLIKKGYNPVTIGLCLQAYSYLNQNSHPEPDVGSSFIINTSEIRSKIDFLVDELIKLKSKNYSGACWGYDFDWQSSTVTIPAYGPTIVATGIIVNALFEYYKLSGNDKVKDLIVSSSDFVLNDLNRTNDGETFCFSYSPFDKESVYNANMKAVRLLSQVYSITKNDEQISTAKKALHYVLKKQNEDGSWYYSNRNEDRRIDNYHTGYVLDCIKEYIELSGDHTPINQLERGYGFYLANFIDKDGCPKFYYNNQFPVDCTSGAQTIITLCKFGDISRAVKVAEYLINNMQSDKGYFYFRRYNNFANKTSFMRWSNAWMLRALYMLIGRIQNHD